MVAAVMTYAVSSSAYAAASEWARASQAVSQRVGSIEDVGLHVWSGFREQSTFGFNGVKRGSARLGLRVKGRRGMVVVKVVMSIDEDGNWRVDRFRFVPP
jgi:hypothetical protein